MINIPTELLRTLVAVVDLRSFTKAAQSLGVTQPAVSAQIKRLQLLLDCELFDKSAPGVSLTPSRRIADQLCAPHALASTTRSSRCRCRGWARRRCGSACPGDFAAAALAADPGANSAREYPDIRFIVRSEHFDIMSRDLRQGELDLMIGLSESRHRAGCPPSMDRADGLGAQPGIRSRSRRAGAARHASARAGRIHRAAVAALNRAQRRFEVVFIGSSKASIVAAVKGGLGVQRVGAQPHGHARASRSGKIAPLPPVGDALLRHLSRREPATGRARRTRGCDFRRDRTETVGRARMHVRAQDRRDRTILSAGSRRRFSSARSPSAAPSRSCAAPARPSPSTSRCRAPRARAGRQRSAAR